MRAQPTVDCNITRYDLDLHTRQPTHMRSGAISGRSSTSSSVAISPASMFSSAAIPRPLHQASFFTRKSQRLLRRPEPSSRTCQESDLFTCSLPALGSTIPHRRGGSRAAAIAKWVVGIPTAEFLFHGSTAPCGQRVGPVPRTTPRR